MHWRALILSCCLLSQGFPSEKRAKSLPKALRRLTPFRVPADKPSFTTKNLTTPNPREGAKNKAPPTSRSLTRTDSLFIPENRSRRGTAITGRKAANRFPPLQNAAKPAKGRKRRCPHVPKTGIRRALPTNPPTCPISPHGAPRRSAGLSAPQKTMMNLSFSPFRGRSKQQNLRSTGAAEHVN